jgi:hypothetical protein
LVIVAVKGLEGPVIITDNPLYKQLFVSLTLTVYIPAVRLVKIPLDWNGPPFKLY